MSLSDLPSVKEGNRKFENQEISSMCLFSNKTFLLIIKHTPPFISNYFMGGEHSQMVQTKTGCH